MNDIIKRFKQLSAVLPGPVGTTPGVVSAATRGLLNAIDNRVRALEVALAVHLALDPNNPAARIGKVGFDRAVDNIIVELDGSQGNKLALLLNQQQSTTTADTIALSMPFDKSNILPGSSYANWTTQAGNRSTKLTYLTVPSASQTATDAVVEVDTGAPLNKQRLDLIGKLRFDTYFIRKLFFITNVVRILRLKLNRELTQSRSVLVSSHAAVSAGLTEYGSDPFTPNETDASYINDGYDSQGNRTGLPRFNDQDTV